MKISLLLLCLVILSFNCKATRLHSYRLITPRCNDCSSRDLSCCDSGKGGDGGCYKEPQDACCSGKICSAPRKCCPAGSIGKGGCIQPPKETCCDGKVCRNNFSCCPKGSSGEGGCYFAVKEQCCPDGKIQAKSKPCS